MLLISLLLLLVFGLLPFTLWLLAFRWGYRRFHSLVPQEQRVGGLVLVVATLLFGGYLYWATWLMQW